MPRRRPARFVHLGRVFVRGTQREDAWSGEGSWGRGSRSAVLPPGAAGTWTEASDTATRRTAARTHRARRAGKPQRGAPPRAASQAAVAGVPPVARRETAVA